MTFLNGWMEGYVFDVPYTADFYYQITPDHLNFCTLLNGYQYPAITDGFSYLELGSGMGFNLNVMAALYPEGEFWGIDFNPEHISFSNKIKKQVELKNINFLELSFEELLNDKIDELPEFDYVVAHGVFSFVSHKNREIIAEIIKRKLKPGGICYLGYNEMCGCFGVLPIQRLILDYSKLFPDVGTLAKISMGINLAKKLKEVGSAYFNSTFMEKLFKRFERDRTNYLAHELLNEDWNPLFFTQVLSYMNKAKLRYIAQADPIWFFNDLFLTDEQIEFLKGLRSPLLKEITKNYMVGMSFRRDIFIRGGQYLPNPVVIKKLKKVKLILRTPINEKKIKVSLPYNNKNANIGNELIEKLMEVLKEDHYTIGEILEFSSFKSWSLPYLLRTASLLIHSRIVDMVLTNTPTNYDFALKLNRIVAKESRFNNVLRTFCIPKSRSGIFVDIIIRLVYDAIANENLKDLDQIISHVLKFTENHGINVTREEINSKISHWIENNVPLWERLYIMDLKL